MPLAQGHSQATISANIGELIKAGHKRLQAAAIAYKTAGIAKDMSDEDWDELLGGLGKFFAEEREEPEHQASDAEPKGYAASVAFMAPGRRVLLLRRADTEENFPGHWAFPGGKADDGEALQDAAKREANEEIGECTFDGITEFDKKRTPFGWEHATYVVPAKDEFKPKLNDEHSGYVWAPLDGLPSPIHPGVKDTITAMAKKSFASDSIAMDRDSVRTKDTDGRLHVKVANISKAQTSPYYGHEIPGWDAEKQTHALGLDPQKIYYLLRDPKELEKAAASFNGIPLQIEHKPTSAADHQTNLTIGATGTDAVYEHPYLKNSLVIWPQYAIDAVETGEQQELSCGYAYDPVMEPGVYEGQHFDGRMTNIRGNHLVITRNGRAGPDVVVGDSALGSTTTLQEISMGKHVLTRKAAVAQGAVLAQLKPLLAADAKLDLGAAFAPLTAKNFKEKRAGVVDLLKPTLKLKTGVVMDAALKAINLALDEVEPEEVEEGMDLDPNSGLPMTKMPKAEDDGDMSKVMAYLKEHAPEHHAAITKMMGGEDEEMKRKEGEDDATFLERAMKARDAKARDEKPEEKKEVVTPAAMDSAIKAAVKTAEEKAKAATEARAFVEPWVGKVSMAHDSAESIHRAALDMLHVAHKDIHSSALQAVIAVQPKPNDRTKTPVIAADESAVKKFSEMFPGADRIVAAA